MAVDSVCTLTPIMRLDRLGHAQPAGDTGPASGFANVLNGILAGNQQANAAADAAVTDLATGKAQDLHTVSLAVAQADMSFRLILELRNRLADAFQEVTRMQV
ncbi:flagellar hook-basal body complex protein : Flagellar hook-basal body complex protein FliE OS=Desulfuromonas acetoxidans DSM 684 GN=fliE PE=3 SV=1: FliE [Gemmataceae bacterium]|nr:flagellar hook-basal body complex protein : Flagellar hook-basal body complex protein FliE OS=Desulfuromonas acetoxidans DSM 684 GN=fliE PE=3 SV=1: FliE [Gemmataceae bacterium]VTT97894.1 flagellar hook-basal body complex protein : Flagellar hook-basal body complex protein FliE OS=Desulfuromonas acetoxidans DSM 684 GN=fliE PE=3 SV=1: FliE [Gemmataceae bacterium]